MQLPEPKVTTLLNLLSSKDKLPETREELTMFALTYSDRTGDWSFVEELEWHDDHSDRNLQDKKLRNWVLRTARSYPDLVKLKQWRDECEYIHSRHTVMIEYYVCNIRIDVNRFERNVVLSQFVYNLRNALHDETL